MASLYYWHDTAHHSYHTIKKLLDTYYANTNLESLNWLISALSEIGCKGFENEIKMAYAENLIDSNLNMSMDEWMNNDYLIDTIPLLHKFSQFTEHAQSKSMADERNDKPFLEQLELFIRPYKDQNYEDNERFIDRYASSRGNVISLFGDNTPYQRESPKVGRNDVCPCGSGKKYKKCCGKP